MKSFGVNPIVAINKFENDLDEEIEILAKYLEKEGVNYSLLENWAKGGEGAVDLAQKIVKICDMPHNFKNTYELEDSIKTKIEKVAKVIYGAEGVDYTKEAEEQIEKIGNVKVPICIAKTQYSLSDDQKNLLCDKPFRITVREVQLKAGPEFVVVKTGKIMTMPGLPKVPAAEKIDLDENKNIVGIF